MIHTAIHDATAAMVIPSDVLHEREFAVAPPPNVSRSTPIIGPSSHMGGSDQFMRVHTSCANGPNNAISTITIMLMDRSNDERLPSDLAKIPAMITPQEKAKGRSAPSVVGTNWSPIARAISPYGTARQWLQSQSTLVELARAWGARLNGALAKRRTFQRQAPR